MGIEAPTPTTTDNWSRPRLQRQELGPMLHDLGHTIFDDAELLLDDRCSVPVATDLRSMQSFAVVLGETLEDAATSVLREEPHTIIDSFIHQNNTSVFIGDKEIVRELTFYGDLEAVLAEGLQSGVVAPLQLFRTVKLVEEDIKIGQDGKLRFETHEVADRIASDEFQTMLHQLATGANSSQGLASTKPSRLRYTGGLEGTFKLMSLHDIRRCFERDDNGRVTGLTSEYLAFQKWHKAEERKANAMLRESGGCPVRHTNFKAIGETARQYFEILENPDARPRFEGESLISRASRFVCRAVEVSLEKAA